MWQAIEPSRLKCQLTPCDVFTCSKTSSTKSTMNPLVIKSRHGKTAVFKEAGCLSVVLRVVLRVVLLENVLLILRHAVKLEGMSFTAVDDI